MLLFVTPNPCIERTYLLDDFACGNVHRVPAAKVLLNAGGKGINATRIAAQITSKVLSLSWAGSEQKAWFAAQLQREGVPHELLESAASTRTCINILRAGHPKTEIVEAGFPLPDASGAALLARIKVLLPQLSLLAICGSYPPAQNDGAWDDHLQEIARMAAAQRVPLLVDSKGAPFRSLLESRLPLWAIKPNTDEAAELLGHPITTPEAEREAVKVLLNYNVENIILSCGKRGAYLGNADGIQFFAAPAINEVSAVGSGDSLVGAFCAQWHTSGDLALALQWGVAAGAANAMQHKSAFCTKADIETLLP